MTLGEWASPREYEDVVGQRNLLCDKLYEASEIIKKHDATYHKHSKILDEIDKLLKDCNY